MVLKFSINPPVKSCRIGCFFDTSRVARRIKDLVDSHSFSLSDINWRTLYADQLPAFYSWTGESSYLSRNNFTDNEENRQSNFREGLCFISKFSTSRPTQKWNWAFRWSLSLHSSTHTIHTYIHTYFICHKVNIIQYK